MCIYCQLTVYLLPTRPTDYVWRTSLLASEASLPTLSFQCGNFSFYIMSFAAQLLAQLRSNSLVPRGTRALTKTNIQNSLSVTDKPRSRARQEGGAEGGYVDHRDFDSIFNPLLF